MTGWAVMTFVQYAEGGVRSLQARYDDWVECTDRCVSKKDSRIYSAAEQR